MNPTLEMYQDRINKLQAEIDKRQLEITRLTLQMEAQTAQEMATQKGYLYFKGKACPKGHTLRYVKNKNCVFCDTANARAYYARQKLKGKA